MFTDYTYYRSVVGVLPYEAFLEIQNNIADFIRNRRIYEYKKEREIISASMEYAYNTAKQFYGIAKNTVKNTIARLRELRSQHQDYKAQNYVLDKYDKQDIFDNSKNPPEKITVYRVVAKNDFKLPDGTEIKRGDKGGYIQHMGNLATKDGSWVGDNCVVAGANTQVSGKSVVMGNVTCIGESIKIASNSVLNGEISILSDKTTTITKSELTGKVALTGRNTINKVHANGNQGKGITFHNVRTAVVPQKKDNLITEITGEAEIIDSRLDYAKITGKSSITSSYVAMSTLKNTTATNCTVRDTKTRGKCTLNTSTIVKATVGSSANIEGCDILDSEVTSKGKVQNSRLCYAKVADKAAVNGCNFMNATAYGNATVENTVAQYSNFDGNAKVNDCLVRHSQVRNSAQAHNSSLDDSRLLDQAYVEYSNINDSNLLDQTRVSSMEATKLTTAGKVLISSNDGQTHEVENSYIKGEGRDGSVIYNTDMDHVDMWGENTVHGSKLNGNEQGNLALNGNTIVDSLVTAYEDRLWISGSYVSQSYMAGTGGVVENLSMSASELASDEDLNLANETIEQKTIIIDAEAGNTVIDKTQEQTATYGHMGGAEPTHEAGPEMVR